jgi:hypothetical protein
MQLGAPPFAADEGVTESVYVDVTRAAAAGINNRCGGAKTMRHADRNMFARELTDGTQTRRLEVNEAGGEGWCVREQLDGAIVRQVIYDDWHRVELQMSSFAAESARLVHEGWRRTV